MNLSSPFIQRPVATTLLMIAMLLSGLMAWRLLPVAALPQVDYPIIQVFTYYPGAGPDITTSAITAPLERRLGQIPGLQQMSSASGSGASVITLKFSLDLDMSVAEQEVQAALSAAGNLLPRDLPAPPVYRKVNPADTPILTLAVTSSTMPLPDLYDLVDTRMAQQLSQINGVGMVSLAGGQRPAIRVQVNPAALASYGLDMEAVRSAIAAANAYGRSKLFIEEILTDLQLSDPRWNIALLRYFNPVGAHPSGRIGEDPNGIPNNLLPFIAQVAVGKLPRLRVFGADYPTPDGTGVRDYIHVVDLARGHLRALEKLAAHPGLLVCNLGTGQGYSVLEMVRAFERASGRPIPYDLVGRRPGDIAICYADPDKARALLGWSAERGLDDMVRDAWRWQSSNPNGYGED